MALKVSNLEREFLYNGLSLADPNPAFTVADVQAMHAGVYPELATAKPVVKNLPSGKQQITFTVAAGVKG